MNETGQNIVHTNTLANLLAEKLALKEKNTEELADIANRYPYFGFAQFLLAKKLSAVDTINATMQLQQCSLYFSNPFWLHYLLSEDGITDNVSLDELAFNTETQAEVNSEELQEKIEEENKTYSKSNISTFRETSEKATDVIGQSQEKLQEENKNELESDSPTLETLGKAKAGIEQLQQKAEETDKTTSESSITSTSKTPTVTQTAIEQPQQKIEETNATVITETSAVRNKTEEKNFEPIKSVTDAVEEVIKNNQENVVEEFKEEKAVSEKTNEEGEEDAEREKLSKLIEQHLSEFRKPIEGNEEIPLTTRVYHAIDYFASQGIKLDPRLISEDKLGSKVKKFTDWLKQMKRVNENPTDLGTDTETEQLIEKIAQTSNEAKDIITETMAQVLVKQGKIEKAIQLYQKLSFLNPSKTTYFAAKINELKGIK